MRTFALLVSAGLASTILAQAPDSNQPTRYQPLEREAGGTWLAHWNHATQTPRSLYGTGLAIEDWRENTLNEARRHAGEALKKYGHVLGLGDSEFRESIGARMGRTWSFKFDQYYRGLPCIGGRADVRVNMSGVIAMLGSTAWQIEEGFDVTPTITEEFAVARAWLALGEELTNAQQPGVERQPRLVIWGDVNATSKAPFYLAWEVPVRNIDGDQGSIGRSYVDAHTGTVLHFANDRHECGFVSCNHFLPNRPAAPVANATAPAAPAVAKTSRTLAPIPTTVTVTGWTRTGTSGTSALVNTPLANLQLNVPGIGNRVTDSNGQFVIDINSPVTIQVGRLDGTHCQPIQGNTEPTASVTVQPGVNATLQILTAGSSSSAAAHTTCYYWVDRTNEWLRTIVGNSSQMTSIDQITASVNQGGSCNAFYTNNTINFYPAGGGCNNTAISTVISHEWGHGLDAQYGGISNSNGDGLSEGWGDILGMFLVDDPIVGQGFTSSGGFIRNGNNTRTYPPPSQVHQAGEVWMGFAWQVRQALDTIYPRAQAIQISDEIVVGSIVADATNQPDAVLQVFVADDDDGNLLNGTPNYASLETAANIKNLPYPEVQIASITHTQLPSTQQDTTPRLVDAVVNAFTGAITQVQLHYQTAGSAAQVRDMFPSGAVAGYRALLPGYAQGTEVDYHIVASHSSGFTVRLPASGEFSYRIAIDEIVFSDNFESGAPGWTHALVQQQDDWQLGTPAGRTGTGWADPSSPANGNGCYANDLGNTINGQLWNGRYQNNVINYLRSPTFDTTGKTGVRLRFNRWLTIESGQYDQAEIWVGGVRVWVNEPLVNHIDTQWTPVDIAIPQADNQPNAQIEWRLVTDGGLTFGGWNIDDVEVYAPSTQAPSDMSLTLLPEQQSINSQVTLNVTTAQGSQPALVVFGTTAGPLITPDVPDLQVGGQISTLFFLTNPAGQASLLMPTPSTVPATGLFIYSHALTLDAQNNIFASNPFFNYFTP